MGLWNGLGLGLGKTSFVSNEGGGYAPEKPARLWRMGKEAYQKKMPHHEGMKQLWETKWRFPVCTISGNPSFVSDWNSAQSAYTHSMMENLKISSLCF